MTDLLASEQVLLSSPMSFSGSRARIWPATDILNLPFLGPIVHAVIGVLVMTVVWAVLIVWNLLAWTLFFLPTVVWRHCRRSQRREVADALRHREMLENRP